MVPLLSGVDLFDLSTIFRRSKVTLNSYLRAILLWAPANLRGVYTSSSASGSTTGLRRRFWDPLGCPCCRGVLRDPDFLVEFPRSLLIGRMRTRRLGGRTRSSPKTFPQRCPSRRRLRQALGEGQVPPLARISPKRAPAKYPRRKRCCRQRPALLNDSSACFGDTSLSS